MLKNIKYYFQKIFESIKFHPFGYPLNLLLLQRKKNLGFDYLIPKLPSLERL